MKQKDSFNYTRRSRWLFLSLLALLLTLGGTTSAWADEVTICDDTSTNYYVPLYGNYADYAQQNQMIYPSEKLTSLVGKQITEMVFYLKSIGSYGQGIGNWTVSMGTTEATILTGLDTTTPLTQVYSGNLTHNNTTDKQIIITFSTPFVYTGSNLLIEFNHPTPNSYKDYTFYGEEAATGSAYTYNAQRSFLPKVKFTYETPASGPSLTVYDGSTKLTSGYSYNFGLTTAGTEKTFTLSNPGTESITLNIAATNGFSVSPTNVTIAAKGEQTLTVTMADATADGTVTITPVEAVDPFTINVSGTIRDPNKVYLDFSDGQMPEGWTDVAIGSYASSYGTAWTVSTGYISQSNNSSSYERAFVSPLLSFEKDETILFETAKYASSAYYSPSIKIQYSTDGSSWETIGSAYTDDVYGTWTKRSVTIPVEGVKYIRFSGWYVQLRNIYGGQLPDGANFAIDTDGTTQSLGAVAIGDIAEKKFTITNSGNAALPVTFTDATDFYVAKTIMFTKPNSWSGDKLYMYAWDGSGALIGAWPGQEITEAAHNDMSEWVYTARLPKGATGIKFSDNASHETGDISTEGFKDVVGLWLDGSVVQTWKNDNFSVPAKDGGNNGTASFAVRMDTKTAGAKSGNIILTFVAINGGSPFTIPVTGAVLPAGTETVDFSALPDGWTNEASNKWSFGDQSAYCTASTSSPAEFVSKKLDFTTNNYFVLTAASNYNDDDCFIKVLGSSDNGTTWTAYSKQIKGRSTIPYGSYADVVVDEIPASVNKLKFQGYYARIKQISGIKYDANDPKISVTQFAVPDPIPVTSGTLKDFGWSNNDAFVIYNISNSGTGTLTISNISVPDGFTAVTEGNAMTVAAGNSLQMTVTMTSGVVGPLGGTITLTTDGGNFEIPVKGFIYGNKNLVDFTDASQYQGWTTEGWTISEGVASVTSSKTMQTTKFSVEANEKLYVEAKSNGSFYSSANLTYSYSTDNGKNWTDGAAAIIASTTSSSDYAVYTLSDIADAEAIRTVLLRFTGANVAINRIYGFTAVATPVMETTAADIAFGSQTAESTEQTFTISNTGTADLTNLSVTLGKTGEDAEYVVRMKKGDEAFTGTTIAPSEVVTVYVKQLFDLENLGSKSDVLTIAADGQESVAINLTGTTRDPSILYVDFDDPNAFPEGWKVGSNWYVYNYGADRYAYQSSSNTPSSLVTTPLKMEEGKTLSFKVARYNSGYGYTTTLKTRYSQNGGATWSDYTAQYGQDSEIAAGSAYTTIELNELPTGDLIFEFFGNNIKLDMIQGIKKTTAPAMALAEDEVAVVNGSTKAFENLKADGTATYTLKNIGNAEMVSTVAVTGGATVAISGEGEGVTIADKTVTLAAGKSATIMLTVPFESPYNDMAGAMTITTTGWVGDFTVNYTATLVDPTDFNEDFADGKPAGWYSDGWTFSTYNGNAYSYNGINKPMITEKIEATSTKNILRFDAKVYYGDDDQTLNVYTSTDRKNWSDAQVFNITSESSTYYLTALAEGQYYVKFEAANVAIDNVKGVKKLAAPAHDLFEISNTITGTGVPGAEYTATVTAVSLIADESDIVAELWLKKAEAYYKVASLENQTLTANESKALTLTGNLPDLAAGDGYKMYITVKKSDDAAYFNTDEVDFTLAHNLELTINSFAVTTPAVQADDNNEYTATFNINVTNTGSRDLSAEEVSVSLINKISDPDVVFTSKWTKANSQTIFLNPGEYSNDGAVLALYSWGKENAWTLFTETATTGFYSAELNGNTGFSIVRLKKSTDEGYSSENGGLNWDNKYNQSVDYTVEDGNVFTFTNWDGEKQSFEKSTMATLAKGISTTLQVTVSGTLTDGEDKNLTFYAREDEKNTILDDGYTYVTRTAAITAAPVIELDETAETYDVAANVYNRKVQVARSFNAGWNTICLPFAVSANDLKTQYGENVALYELTSFENNNLQFSKINEGETPAGITAGKPYLIYVEEAITAPKTFLAAQVSAETPADDIKGSATFKGTYTKMAAGLLENKYGVSSDNRIAKGNASTTMKGFRAYLEGALAGARIAIIDETTGITRVYGADEIFGKDDKVYDLNGRRVENAKKGIYIVNGRKMVVK